MVYWKHMQTERATTVTSLLCELMQDWFAISGRDVRTKTEFYVT